MTETGSRYFRLQHFRRLVKRHLGSPGRFNGEYLTVDTAIGGFRGLVGRSQTEALRVDSSSDSLFRDDWEDISIRVFRRDRFDRVRDLGQAYEQLTGRIVTIVCYFEPDPEA